MKVLSDWLRCDPVYEGLYLARIGDKWKFPELMRWDGRMWRWADGVAFTGTKFSWCGLSFNPEVAYLHSWTKETEWWSVEVPR